VQEQQKKQCGPRKLFIANKLLFSKLKGVRTMEEVIKEESNLGIYLPMWLALVTFYRVFRKRSAETYRRYVLYRRS